MHAVIPCSTSTSLQLMNPYYILTKISWLLIRRSGHTLTLELNTICVMLGN